MPTLAEFASRKQITFPLLSDAGSATIKAFGILNPMPAMAFGPDKDDPAVVAELRKYVSGGRTNPSWVGIAFPGTFILDPQGRVVSLFFEDYYVEPQPFVRVLPVAYPPSEIYVFTPLNERVPVFQKPFTLVQELVLEGTAAAQAALEGKEALTIRGTLDYQSCDDTLCFNPVSLPLTWTVGLKALVTERAPQRQP